MHKHNRNPELGFTPFDLEFIKHYIAAARQYEPYAEGACIVSVLVVVPAALLYFDATSSF